MSEEISRRGFLQQAGRFSLGFAGLQLFAAQAEAMETGGLFRFDGYGSLVKDPAGILDLPKGFSYQIISRAGDLMADGFLVPGKADGMAAFPGPDGKTILVRNHELDQSMMELGPFGAGQELLKKLAPHQLFDGGGRNHPCIGGTTTMVYDTRTQKLEKEFLSLTGTIRNCAGGPTPWNTWLSCEEAVDKVSDIRQHNHGYVFEVPAQAEPALAAPRPIKAMGRFHHEAVAVSPDGRVVYLTEDRMDGLLYRFLPKIPGDMHSGGRLQALSIADIPSCDTRNWFHTAAPTFPRRRPLQVQWLDLDDIDSPKDDLRYRGFLGGAARFARGEGIWYGDGEVYIACTNGGKKTQGQIFRYQPSPHEGTPEEGRVPGTVELYLEPNRTRLLQNCDNLTQSPSGDLIVCEDRLDARLIGITPSGDYYVLAENTGFPSEFAGVTFSPDGTTLFVNIQHAGLTLAITGPWAHMS
ncbi:MAG: DUF839 domain-containing protein [Bacteroidetes bacterium]|nr:MAG: DUF839 domain-containing protein [Bacteroidota bacterium]